MNKAPAHDGAHAVMLLMRAKNRLHDNQLDDAMKDLNEALRLHPRLGEALMVRATILVDKGELQQALQDVEQRLLLDPPDPMAVLTRGNLRACLGNHELALADFTSYIEQGPPMAIALRARAQTFVRLHREDEAIADLNTALGMEPGKGEIYLERGRTYQDMGRYPAALADYQKALELEPKLSGVYNQYAWMLAACPEQEFRDGARAVLLARRACELTKWEDANLIDTLACAHAECGQFDEALRWAKKALEKANDDTSASVRTRVQLFQSGRPARFDTEETAP
jgi:tetratricopeptide (TPR) repeat protein